MLLQPSSAELLHAIAEHPHGLLESMAAIPGSEFHEEGKLTWYTTPVVSPMFAGAFRIALDEAEVDDAIERVHARWRDANVPYAFWWTGPETKPADFGTALQRHGCLPWDLDAPGMAVEIALMPEQRPVAGDVRIERVNSVERLHDWKRAFVAGMEVPDFAGQAWVEATTRVGVGRSPWRLLVAYLDHEPVAVCGMIPVAGVASVFAVATAPEARGKGIGGAITAAGIRLLAAEGYRWAVLFSTEMGEPVYRRLGFERYCAISRYLWRNAT